MLINIINSFIIVGSSKLGYVNFMVNEFCTNFLGVYEKILFMIRKRDGRRFSDNDLFLLDLEHFRVLQGDTCQGRERGRCPERNKP